MTEVKKRPTLVIPGLVGRKFGPGGPIVEAPPPPPPPSWACKPCGAKFDPPAEGEDDTAVRCPSCNAKLGKLAAFRAPEAATGLRARRLTA